MIVVDTSVWVEAFRGGTRAASELSRLLDDDLAALVTPVRMELLGGARRGEWGRLRRVLGAVPTFAPAESTWRRVEQWTETSVKAGQRFGVMDLLIAATAAERKASVWSLDADFERMAKLRLIRVHRPG
jgi:predicted nucleic acid-binding protein